jgi:hypothetical protein
MRDFKSNVLQDENFPCIHMGQRNPGPKTGSTCRHSLSAESTWIRGAFMKTAFISVCIVLLMSSPGFSEKRAFTIEDLYHIKSVSDPQISPNGKSIAFGCNQPGAHG